MKIHDWIIFALLAVVSSGFVFWLVCMGIAALQGKLAPQ